MRRLFFICFLAFATKTFSQNVGINGTAATPDPSAMLDVSATNKGLLVPRVALTAANVAAPITSPLTSLLIYNTATAGTSPNDVTPGYYYWDGSKWARFVTGSYLNSSQISAIGKFYSTLTWAANWTNGSTLYFVITDTNMLCGTTASAAFVSFDCTYTNATMAGFTIRNVKCNAGTFVVTVTNNSGTTYTPGSIPITMVAFY